MRMGVAGLACALVLGGAGTAGSAPRRMLVVDPAGDANYLNDQSLPVHEAGSDPIRNNTTPADASAAADLLGVWMSNTSDTVTFHVMTEAPLPAAVPVHFRIDALPYEGAANTDCLTIKLIFPGTTSPTYTGSETNFHESCTGVDLTPQVVTRTLPDGSGVVEVTVPRDASPFFDTGQMITGLNVETRDAFGAGATRATVPAIDNTLIAKPYRMRP